MDTNRETYTTVTQLDKDLWVINELGKTHMFLINGADKALLVDTGLGISDLPSIIRRLCGDKPVTVVNTHSHGDHNSGNYMFDTVYVDRFDEVYAHRAMGEQERKFSRESYFLDAIERGFRFEDWDPKPAGKIVSFGDGFTFDLGNYRLEVIEIPSHTAGSIALYEPEKGWLITGDVLLEWETWGHLTESILAPSVSLKEYRSSLLKLKQRAGHVSSLLVSHGKPDNHVMGCTEYTLPVSAIDIYIKGITDVIDGCVEVRPYSSMWEDGYVAHFPIGGVVFQKDRIY